MNGNLITGLIVIVLIVITLVSKKEEWFGSKKDRSFKQVSPLAPPSRQQIPASPEESGWWWWRKIKSGWKKIRDAARARERKEWAFFLGLLLCHILVMYFKWDLWVFFAKKPTFWVDQAVPIFVFFWLRKEKKIHPIGIAIGLLLIAGNVYQIWQWYEVRENKVSHAGIQTPNWVKGQFTFGGSPTPATATATNLPSPRSSTLPAGTWRPTLKRPQDPPGPQTEEVRAFFTENLHSAELAEDMVIICQNESGCSHFEKDGKTVKRHHNNNGAADDLGLFGINEGWWKKDVAQEKDRGNVRIGKYNILDPDDNQMAALHLVQKYGLDPWSAEDKDRTVFHQGFVMVPVGTWIQIPLPRRVEMTPEDPVEVLTSDGQRFRYVPGMAPTQVGKISWIKYMSGTDKPVRVNFAPAKN